MTEEERRRRLIAMGLDPTQYRYVTNEEKAYEDMTGTGAFLTGAGEFVGAGVGGLGGAAAGAALGAPLGPLGILAGGLVGGFGGGFAGGAAQRGIEDAALDDAEEQALALKRKVALEKHPYLTLAGQFAPSLIAARPSLTTIRNIPKAFINAPTRSQTAMQRYALASSGFGGGLEAGIEAGGQALRGEDMDWGRIGTAGLLGGLFTEPTRAFGKIGATVARRGETSKQFLERTGMLRPLTETEAIAENAEIAARHQRSLREAAEKVDKDSDAAEVVKSTEAEVKADADEARRTEPTKEQEADAEKQVSRDIDEADTARMKAHGELVKAENDLNNLPPDLNDTPFVARQRKLVAEKKAASDEANNAYTKAKEERIRMRKERAARELDASAHWERHSRRKAAIDGTEPRPVPDNLLKSAQTLAARLGITWHKAIPELYALDEKGKKIDLRGKYNVREHSITLDSLRAEADTSFHEYVHGLYQVLKRSPDRKHSGLIEMFENDLFKDSPRWKELESTARRKLWAEERITESSGVALMERMNNPPKGWTDKLQRWMDDWRLEREARKGFPVKEGELSDAHFQRIADWVAMRGERQPALQPKQLELMLGDLAVRSPLDDFGPLSGGKRYADDLLTEEAVAAKDEEAKPLTKEQEKGLDETEELDKRLRKAEEEGRDSWEVVSKFMDETGKDPIDKLKAKIANGKKITISHVGAEDLSGQTQDALRNVYVGMDLERRIGSRGNLDEKTINLTKGQNFLEGAGHGADIVVLHRIPDERLAGVEQAGPTAKGHTGENWRNAVAKSNAELVYVTWHKNAVDFEAVDFADTPGYKFIADKAGDVIQEPQESLLFAVLKKEKAAPAEDIRGQAVRPSKENTINFKVYDRVGKNPTYSKADHKLEFTSKGTSILYHVTTPESFEGIQKEGFRTPDLPEGIFGPGFLDTSVTKFQSDAIVRDIQRMNSFKTVEDVHNYFRSRIIPIEAGRLEKSIAKFPTSFPDAVGDPQHTYLILGGDFHDDLKSVVRGQYAPWRKKDLDYKAITESREPLPAEYPYSDLRKKFMRKNPVQIKFDAGIDIRKRGYWGHDDDYIARFDEDITEIPPHSIEAAQRWRKGHLDKYAGGFKDFSATRYQPVKPEEFVAAVDVMAKHDPTLLKKYSKRVRGKMMDRIKKGTFSVAQGQQILARFASRPFPDTMSGEEIAQVVNGLEMYHGSVEAESVLREGFKGEELSPSGNVGRGIYMTPNKRLAASYAGADQISLPTTPGVPVDLDVKDFTKVIPIRTNFKRLLDISQNTTHDGLLKMLKDYVSTARDLGYVIEDSSLKRVSDSLEELPHKRTYEYHDVFKNLDAIHLDSTDLKNAQPVNIAGTTQDFRNRVLNKMGYDGLTYKFLGDREVVAFREPFEAATDQLHEYYGGERLQDVDKFLEDVSEYQLNTNTDHFSSNPATKRPFMLDSIVDQIRKTAHKGSRVEQKTANEVANALDAAARDAQRLEGEFHEQFEFIEQKKVSLSAEDGQHAAIYMAHMRRGMPEGIPADTLARYNAPDSPVKHYVDFFYRNYTETRRRSIKADMKIWHPKAGELLEAGTDPAYAPEMMNQDMLRVLNGKEGAKARNDAKKELVDWWEANLDEPGSITRDELEQAAGQYVSKLSGGSVDHLGSTKFGALRKAESIGLPLRLKEDGSFAWIENHAGRAYQRYMRRFARDFSFFKNVESNDFVRQALGIMKQDRTYDAALPQEKNPFHVQTAKDSDGIDMNKGMTTDKNLKDFIKAYLGHYEGDELFGRTANRLVVSHWLGVMSGARDLFSSYVFALPHLRVKDMHLMLTSLKDFKRNWRQSHLMGVNKSHYNRLEFATETHNQFVDFFEKWSDIASKYGGRTPIERLTRMAQFGLGRAAVMQHIGLAQGVSVTADRNLRRLGQMSGVDVSLLRRHANKDDTFSLNADNPEYKQMVKDLQEKAQLEGRPAPDIPVFDEALDRMAASWVDANQGTYDVRGVPAWTMSGPMANFTSLARWNIEKLNMTRKELVNPIVDEGDWRPFIKATLGAAFTGTLLIELSEFINNKFRGDATLMEAAREGDKEEMTYAVADSLNYAGYFGLGSAVFNDIAVSLLRGRQLRTGGVVFPAYDFIGHTLMEPVLDATTAISEGAEPLSTVFEAIKDVLEGTMQTYRIMYNHDFLIGMGEGREEAEKKNIRRDLRIFRKFEGVRGAPPTPGMGNRYLRPDTRAFKEAETVGESVEQLPAAFEEQRKRAKGRGDKLKSYTTGLYTIPDKTLPAVATPEGVEEFMRYKDYLTRQEGWFSARGERYWKRIFNEWADNKRLTATKKALVKSYVQHLIERGAR